MNTGSSVDFETLHRRDTMLLLFQRHLTRSVPNIYNRWTVAGNTGMLVHSCANIHFQSVPGRSAVLLENILSISVVELASAANWGPSVLNGLCVRAARARSHNSKQSNKQTPVDKPQQPRVYEKTETSSMP